MQIEILLDSIKVCRYTPKLDEIVAREVAEDGETLVVVVMFIILCVVRREVRTDVGAM